MGNTVRVVEVNTLAKYRQAIARIHNRLIELHSGYGASEWMPQTPPYVHRVNGNFAVLIPIELEATIQSEFNVTIIEVQRNRYFNETESVKPQTDKEFFEGLSLQQKRNLVTNARNNLNLVNGIV